MPEAVQRSGLTACQREKDLMSRRITLPILLFLTIVAASSCHRSKSSPAKYMGQLVAYHGCSHYIVKFLDGPITDSSVLVKSWIDTAYHNGAVTDTTFTNVFTVKNWITFQQANLKLGDMFTFELNQHDPNTGTYYTCDIWPIDMPAVSNTVTDIRLVCPSCSQ